MQVSASGGEPVAVTNIDQSRSENSHRWPQFLPDGRRFLCSFEPTIRRCVAFTSAPLIVPPKDSIARIHRGLVCPGRDAGAGYLLWVRDDQLVAQPFDAASAQLVGDPFRSPSDRLPRRP